MKSNVTHNTCLAGAYVAENKPHTLAFVLDGKGYINATDQRFADFFGVPVSDVSFLSLLHANEQSRFLALLDTALPGMPVQDQFYFTTATSFKTALLTLVLFYDDSGTTCYQCLLRAMAEQYREEELVKLRWLAEENTRKMLAIAECTNDCLFMINARGYLEYHNQNAQNTIGNACGVQLGQSLDEVMQRTNSLEFLPRYREVMRTKQPQQFEAFYASGKSWLEINVFPANGGILVYYRNIDERKRAELALALSEQKFKAMVQNGSDIIAVLNKQMHMQYLSPSVERIAGFKPDELVGKNTADFIHPDDLQKVLHDFGEVLEFSNDGNETSHRFRHKAGHYIWLESKAINLVQDNGIAGIIINARDITHHKELKAKLELEVKSRQKEVTNAVIKAQERERSQLGQELHDNVNQVLTTIKLYNEMVLEGIGNGKEMLPRAIFHLQSCINEIRSISKRLSAPTLGKISLHDSVRELVDSVNLTNRLMISYRIKGLEGCAISEDLHLGIYRIIQEQLNNTLKYAKATRMQITITNNPDKLLVVLQDDGEGFDVAQKKSGIGITNMKTRAENLNGSFHICSQPGAGCRVEVMFPPVAHSL
jgi:PAS domain S-box-containing protein